MKKTQIRVFMNKFFANFVKEERISNNSLLDAVERVEKGLIDADLGGGVIKQRIARPGQGKSRGYRSIILFRTGERAFFIFGYSKKDMDNISDIELKTYKKLALRLSKYSDRDINEFVKIGVFIEVKH